MVETDKGISYPSILFRAAGGLYAANSRYISTILELPEYQSLPDAPDYITGVFPYRDRNVTMFDLRTALNLPTLAKEFGDFTAMLDARKDDHIKWISELERSLSAGEPFQLATDPHQCALGRWYDQFHTDNQTLSHHMAKLDDPHQRLHRSALAAEACLENPDKDEQVRCVKKILRTAKEEYVPKVLGILDNAKEIFRATAYHEMVLVLGGETTLGLVVDEVVSVEQLAEESTGADLRAWSYSPYISRIVKSENSQELILEVDIPAILACAELELSKRTSP